MENEKQVGKEALRYRIVTNEIVGVAVSFGITGLAEILFFIIKVQNAVFYDIIIFTAAFILQFVVIYLLSLMQYKNLKYVIGQNAVSFQSGALSIERETIPFEKVKSSVFDQSLIQRLFSVGDITIDQDEEKYVWEDVDIKTATLISDAVSVKGDVQPITVSEASAVVTPPQIPA